MKRATIVKTVGVIAGVVVLVYAALLLGARSGHLQQLVHDIASDKYVAYSFSGYGEGRFYKANIVLSAGGQVSLGDTAETLKFCPAHSDWICLESSTIKFAMPRRALNVGDHWRFSGVEYALLPSYRDSIPGGIDPNSYAPMWSYGILGRHYDVYVIKADYHEPNEWSQIFLFSPVHGLIGYMQLGDNSLKYDPRNATSWLTGEDGPGSNDFDRAIKGSAYMSADEIEKLQK